MLRQFAAAVAVAIENARLFEREREYAETLETLAEIGREVSSILDLDELLARIAQLARRVIDYRTFGILLAQRGAGELEMKLAVQYGEKTVVPPVAAGEGPGRLCRAAQGGRARARRVAGPALHQAGGGRSVRAGDPAALKDRCIGVVRPREPRARRVHQEPRRDPDAAGQPGGGGHRERAALRDDPGERGAAGEGAAVRAARAGGAAADRAAEAAEGRGRGRALRAGARAGRRPVRLPRRRKPNTPGRRGGRRVGQGRAGRALQRVRRGAGRGRARSAAATRRSGFEPGGGARVDEHDPPPAPARGVLLHALSTRCST